MFEESAACILVIDDEIFIRTIISPRLRRSGYRIVECGDTTAAYEMLQMEKPAIVICDVLMPGEDGVSFCRRLHAEGNRTPFLFMTTQGQAHNVVDGLTAGADAYLIKPVDLSVLEARVVSLLHHP